MEQSSVIHFNLFRPEYSLFKQKANTKAEIQVIVCSNTNNCQLLLRKECALRSGACPYGKLSVLKGPTRRSRKYRTWCNSQEKKYNGVPFLNIPKQLGIVGDYIFLPYQHIKMIKDLPMEKETFINAKEFTVDNIIRLVKARPQSLFGGEIRSYQKDVPPLMLKHLSEQMPDLFKAVIEKDSFCADRYAEFSNIGREAILQTLTPNADKLEDIHGGLWDWDGVELHSLNSKMSFGLCKFSKVSITPEARQKVKITNENQVNKSTVFID